MVNQILSTPIYLAVFIVIAVLFIWNLIITILFFSLKIHYTKLTDKVNKKNLQNILEDILQKQIKHNQACQNFTDNLQKLENNTKFHLKNIGFKRYNPFKDTGGDQSFILSLLDDFKNGIIISSLHSRDNTRIYSKLVKEGQGVDFPLSKEEKKVVDKAKSFKA